MTSIFVDLNSKVKVKIVIQVSLESKNAKFSGHCFHTNTNNYGDYGIGSSVNFLFNFWTL